MTHANVSASSTVKRLPDSLLRTADGASLFVEDWGEGRPVVFTHSWALSSAIWQHSIEHLAHRNVRCLAYDRRGHGRSSRPFSGYEYDTLADDLATLLERLDLERVTLVGHSMGCGEIVRYVARHGSSRIDRIVLVAPFTPFILQTADNPMGVPEAYIEEARRQIATDFPKWIEDNKIPFFTPDTSLPMMNWIAGEMLRTPVKVALDCNRAMIATDLRPELARIDRPTLVIHGDKDVSAPLDLTGRQTAAMIPRAELVVYEGGPHGLFVSHLQRLNRDLCAFIEV